MLNKSPDAPPFFIPHGEPKDQEELYAALASLCGKSALPIAKRIYSITYRHNGEVWTATVGQRLSGTRTRGRRVQGLNMEVPLSVSDPAVVWAIFPGHPFFVVTNHRLASNVGSAWENPFYAGEPTRTVYFAPPKEADGQSAIVRGDI